MWNLTSTYATSAITKSNLAMYLATYLDLRHYLEVRGWVRKFCHRCHNQNNAYGHDRLVYYTLIERATLFLYNDTKIMHNRNTLHVFELFVLKDICDVTTGMFS